MKTLKRNLKYIAYSFGLIYRSSGLSILIYLILSLVGSILTLLETYALKKVIDILTYQSSNTNFHIIITLIVAYVLLLVIRNANVSLQQILNNDIHKKAEHRYDCEVNQKLSEIPLSIVDSSKEKDMIDDVKHSKLTVVNSTMFIMSAISHLFSFVVAFLTLFKFNHFFSTLLLFLTVPGIIFKQIFDKKAEELRLKTAPDVRKFCYYRWMLTDVWPAKDIRMYDLTDSIRERYDEEKNQYVNVNKKLDKKKLYFSLLAELIRRSGEISFTLFVIYQAITGQISLGDIVLYIGFALTVGNSFKSMLWLLVFNHTRLNKIMDRVFDFFAIKTEQNNAIRKLEAFKALTFDNVYFKYPYTEKYVLNGVSFTLNKGDKLSIVGINGSGKSTIIKLMLGLYEIESGQILINGYPMSDYDIRDVRKLFSALFQSFVQYPLTLRENIALSSLERIDDSDEIESVLRQSGVYEDIKPKLENGLDSFMTRKFDDKGTELSKGQWQKIALSRAYFKNAPIIIFDEPSAALDAEAEDRIFKNFESISDGKTGIMISHRISSARMSNKIIVLDGGKITEQGTHEELVSLNGLYAKLYNLQREKYTIKEGD